MNREDPGEPATGAERNRVPSPVDERAIHADLTAVLPQVLDRYLAFARKAAPEDPRAFAAHQAACRAALAHLNLLIRSIQAVTGRDGEDPAADGTGLIHEARQALRGAAGEPDHDDDG